MTGVPASRRPALDDVGAGWRHFRCRVWTTSRDPLALGMLVFAGVVTIPLWGVGLGLLDHLIAALLMARTATPDALPGLALFSTSLVLTHLLWSVLVAVTVAGRVLPSAARPAVGRAMPALPIGPRARLTAEALAGLAFVLATRTAVLALVGEPLGRQFLWGAGGWWSGLGYPSILARTTALGVLVAFPVLLAWTATDQLDGRGLTKPALVMALVSAGALAGAMAHLWSALLLWLLLSAFVLVRLDDGDRPGSTARARPARLPGRVSPGPVEQLGRDAWRGPLRTLWPVVVGAVALPLVLDVLYPRRFALLVFVLLLLALATLPFFPFGLKLVGSRRALFSGQFLRAWAPLPVPRERVIRTVYLHGLVAAGSVWLLLCASVARNGGKAWLPLFVLPGVFLAAGTVVCEAIGDRRRGLLAIACLVGFPIVVPLALVLANFVLDLSSPGFGPFESWLMVEAYALGLLGGIPPLVHLRGRSRSGT